MNEKLKRIIFKIRVVLHISVAVLIITVAFVAENTGELLFLFGFLFGSGVNGLLWYLCELEDKQLKDNTLTPREGDNLERK